MRRCCAIWLLAVVLCLQEGALANSPRERAAALASSGEQLVPLRQAIWVAEQRYAGTVIEAEVKPGRPYEQTPVVYELRLLSEAGHILKIRLDALNGDFLEAEGRGLQDARRKL